jgi:TolB protein
MKIPVEGGMAVPVIDKPCHLASISPDSNWVACLYSTAKSQQLAILPFLGGPPAKLFTLSPTLDDEVPFAWTPDSRAVGFVDNRGGTANIWIQPIAGGSAKQLTHFTGDHVRAFAWSSDGRQIAITRALWTEDAILISGFR